jgi:hypothetical protein
MDLTGYGYKRPAPEKRVTANPVAALPARSPELSEAATRLLDMVVRKCPMREVPARFPRVLNQIAAIWSKPLEVECALEQLLMDCRGSRAGFPPEVLVELLALRDYNAGRTIPKKIDPWQEMHLR